MPKKRPWRECLTRKKRGQAHAVEVIFRLQRQASQRQHGREKVGSDDGGFLDDEGYISITDRKKDVIISGGENVSSIEVEDTLFSHPAVVEVAVIGVPHEKWGETVKALVVLTYGSDVTESQLIAHCRDNLTHYKCPTSIEIRTELARTATGKLQKFKLRAPYWEGRDKMIN